MLLWHKYLDHGKFPETRVFKNWQKFVESVMSDYQEDSEGQESQETHMATNLQKCVNEQKIEIKESVRSPTPSSYVLALVFIFIQKRCHLLTACGFKTIITCVQMCACVCISDHKGLPEERI